MVFKHRRRNKPTIVYLPMLTQFITHANVYLRYFETFSFHDGQSCVPLHSVLENVYWMFSEHKTFWMTIHIYSKASYVTLNRSFIVYLWLTYANANAVHNTCTVYLRYFETFSFQDRQSCVRLHIVLENVYWMFSERKRFEWQNTYVRSWYAKQ